MVFNFWDQMTFLWGFYISELSTIEGNLNFFYLVLKPDRLLLFLLRRFKVLRCGSLSCKFAFTLFEASARAVKTPGRGSVLTRFLLPFHRMEKEEPVRLEDKKV